MVSGAKVVMAAGAGSAILGLGLLFYKKFRPRGTPTSVQWDTFRKMGDLNSDGYIDAIDQAIMNAAFNSTPSDPNWNPACDLTGNGLIDIFDVNILATNFGRNIWDYFGL